MAQPGVLGGGGMRCGATGRYAGRAGLLGGASPCNSRAQTRYSQSILYFCSPKHKQQTLFKLEFHNVVLRPGGKRCPDKALVFQPPRRATAVRSPGSATHYLRKSPSPTAAPTPATSPPQPQPQLQPQVQPPTKEVRFTARCKRQWLGVALVVSRLLNKPTAESVHKYISLVISLRIMLKHWKQLYLVPWHILRICFFNILMSKNSYCYRKCSF